MLLEAFKYTHGLYSVGQDMLVQDKSGFTRGHSHKLVKKRCNLDIRKKNFFSLRVVDTWNKLPARVAEAPSLQAFKNRLDLHWSHRMYKWD